MVDQQCRHSEASYHDYDSCIKIWARRRPSSSKKMSAKLFLGFMAIFIGMGKRERMAWLHIAIVTLKCTSVCSGSWLMMMMMDSPSSLDFVSPSSSSSSSTFSHTNEISNIKDHVVQGLCHDYYHKTPVAVALVLVASAPIPVPGDGIM